MTTQAEAYEQTEAFPRTTLEILRQLRCIHADALEEAIAAFDALSDDEKIAKRYEKAEAKVASRRDLLRNIDRAIEELTAEPKNPYIEAAADLGLVDRETGEVLAVGGEA